MELRHTNVCLGDFEAEVPRHGTSTFDSKIPSQSNQMVLDAIFGGTLHCLHLIRRNFAEVCAARVGRPLGPKEPFRSENKTLYRFNEFAGKRRLKELTKSIKTLMLSLEDCSNRPSIVRPSFT